MFAIASSVDSEKALSARKARGSIDADNGGGDAKERMRFCPRSDRRMIESFSISPNVVS
jgi:hypothetical protein